jgi:hypothetical protein
VVKAVSLSGSQGVLRADDRAGAVAAARRIRQVLAGARLPQPILSEALGTAARAAAALRLRHGPIHAELRLDARDSGRRPTMLELAARSIGGLRSRALRFWTG